LTNNENRRFFVDFDAKTAVFLRFFAENGGFSFAFS